MCTDLSAGIYRRGLRQKGRFMSKPYEELTFADNFMFCKILSNDLELCKDLLELILGFKISKVELSQTQKEIDIKYDSKAVRLDVYVEDGKNTVYDIEMQKVDTHELPKRSRYYQAMIDLNLIEKGDYYAELKKCYVIFICLDNPFKPDLPLLTFENTCDQDTDIKLNDETYKVFVNAKSTAPDIPESVRNLFDYLTKKEVRDELTKRIDERVTEAIAHQKWRVEYMTYAVTFLDAKEEGRAEGQAKGIIQTLDSLVKDGILTVSDAAQRAGMTEEKFVQAAKQYALSEE